MCLPFPPGPAWRPPLHMWQGSPLHASPWYPVWHPAPHPLTGQPWGSEDSQERPGDTFHPDYADGCPTYYDVSVCNMFHSGNLKHTSVQAGAAAAATGEIYKHAANVEHTGGCFSPLVMETLGVWTTSSLSILQTIAAQTTVLNGLPVKSQHTTSLLSYQSKAGPKMLKCYCNTSPSFRMTTLCGTPSNYFSLPYSLCT